MDKSCPFDERGDVIAHMLLCLGQFCTADSPAQRPEMVSVLRKLETLKIV